MLRSKHGSKVQESETQPQLTALAAMGIRSNADLMRSFQVMILDLLTKRIKPSTARAFSAAAGRFLKQAEQGFLEDQGLKKLNTEIAHLLGIEPVSVASLKGRNDGERLREFFS
jgi:hypothetical protein